jgi:hypothetical protein
MNAQGEKGVDSGAERDRCLLSLCRRQESWSQAGNGQTQVGSQKQTYLTTIKKTERTELNRELMRPAEKRTQVKSMKDRATFQNTKKKNTSLTKKRKAEPYRMNRICTYKYGWHAE